MIPLRRLGAILAALALSVTTMSAGLVPCDMDTGRLADSATQPPLHAHHAPAHHDHEGASPGSQAPQTATDSRSDTGAPASCPVMGPCMLHPLAVSAVARPAMTLAKSRIVESPALAPTTRSVAPELPPPRA